MAVAGVPGYGETKFRGSERESGTAIMAAPQRDITCIHSQRVAVPLILARRMPASGRTFHLASNRLFTVGLAALLLVVGVLPSSRLVFPDGRLALPSVHAAEPGHTSEDSAIPPITTSALAEEEQIESRGDKTGSASSRDCLAHRCEQISGHDARMNRAVDVGYGRSVGRMGVLPLLCRLNC